MAIKAQQDIELAEQQKEKELEEARKAQEEEDQRERVFQMAFDGDLDGLKEILGEVCLIVKMVL